MILLLQDFFLFNYSFESLESFSLAMKKITKTIQKKQNKTKQNQTRKNQNISQKIIK